MTVVHPKEAIPIVGLYLRQQGRFVVGASTDRADAGYPVRSLFYWRAARALLPAAPRWKAAFGAYHRSTGDSTLSLLYEAVVQRIDQTLRSRDRLLAAMARPQDIDTLDDALSEFDQILLWLMAAFDASARAAHIALGMGERVWDAGWQRDRWLAQVPPAHRALADLVRAGSAGHGVLTILSRLRNTIHGSALSASGTIPVIGRRAFEPLVELQGLDRDAVLGAIEAVGGQEAWGLDHHFPDAEVHLHPGDFVERLIPQALSLLDRLLDATPVELLPGVDGANWSRTSAIPLAPHEERTLWQLGLSPV